MRGALHVGDDLSASASAVIDGGVVRDGPYTPFETARFVIPGAGTGDDLRLGPGETASLAAGAHGAVDLAPRSRLVLAHGAHSMSSLSLAPGAEIIVEGDAVTPTIIRVEGSFRWQGSVSSSSGPALSPS